ncbi:MAG TPA: DoxX family protein [Candidatus Binatia bacterium]
MSKLTQLCYLVPLRLWIGYYMLQQGSRKFNAKFPQGDWIGRQIGDVNTVETFDWYKNFLVNTVAPHKELFGQLVMYGELAVGVCVILGLLTRYASIVGLFMMANYFCAIGWPKGGAPQAQQITFAVSFLVFILASPGRVFGLDAMLFGRGGGAPPKRPERRP